MPCPFVNIHTHSRTGEGIELVSVMAGSGDLPLPPCSMGIHPWQAGDIDIYAALAELEKAPVSAIGEIGLDYSRSVSRPLQAKAFEEQLGIAMRRRLPVVLHCVRAFEPVMEILRGYALPAVIFHGFIGSRQQAARAVEAGYYLSFGERSLASPKTVEAMKSAPMSAMFLETDGRNAGGDLSIAEIYRLAVGLMPGMDIESMKKSVYQNYIEIFG